jgi:hypothetical protein
MKSIVLFDPTAPREEGSLGAQPQAKAKLKGAVVGFIDNAKPNFNHLVDDARPRCRRRSKCCGRSPANATW